MSTDSVPTAIIEFPKGALLVREGEPGGDVLIILSGTVEVFLTRGGREWPVGELQKGEILGVMTATTGGARTASARATSDVTATIVHNAKLRELLEQMPMWGRAIVKDLISRLNQANKLYIENATIAAGSSLADDPLSLACMVASSTLPIMRMMAASGAHVHFDDFLAKMAEILSVDPQRIDHIISVFVSEKLLEPVKGDANARVFDVHSVQKLSTFRKFVDDLRLQLNSEDGFQKMLAVGERELLMQIAEEHAEGCKSSEQYVEVKLNQVQSDLRRASAKSLDPEILKRAEALGYLTFSVAGEQPAVRFQPLKLIEIMRCYSAAKKLNPRVFAERKVRKTLVY